MVNRKPIGPSFPAELGKHEGLIGQHFSWNAQGFIEFFDDTPDEVKEGVLAVYEAHDPTALPTT